MSWIDIYILRLKKIVSDNLKVTNKKTHCNSFFSFPFIHLSIGHHLFHIGFYIINTSSNKENEPSFIRLEIKAFDLKWKEEILISFIGHRERN